VPLLVSVVHAILLIGLVSFSFSVQELSPQPSLLQKASTGLLQPPMPAALPAVTPRTPNFPVVAPQAPIAPENLTKWAETVAMMITSPLTLENSSALTALGDQLLACNWVDAAHAWYVICYLPYQSFS